MTEPSNTLLTTRATRFLKSKGYLTGIRSPARASMILSAFNHLDPRAFEEIERAAKLVGGRRRWVLMRGLCLKHGISLLPMTEPEPEEMRCKDFYASKGWRTLRMRVLEKRGARCECCGASARDGVRLHVDHIRPRSRYPDLALDESNLQVLCEDCNMGKGARYTTDWRSDANV